MIDYRDGRTYDSPTTEHAKKDHFWHDYDMPGSFTASAIAIDDSGVATEASCTFTYTWIA